MMPAAIKAPSASPGTKPAANDLPENASFLVSVAAGPSTGRGATVVGGIDVTVAPPSVLVGGAVGGEVEAVELADVVETLVGLMELVDVAREEVDDGDRALEEACAAV